jgi:diguanylate cyclase (GGDEF)-like protein
MPYELADAAGARRRPVKRLVATIFMVGLCFCAICVKVLLDARHAAWDHAAQTAASLVATLESDIARNIESYDLSLRGVIENLAYPEITTISPELRQLVLFDRSASAKHLNAIVLLDENGIVRLDSRNAFPRPRNRSDRGYFQFHKNSTVHRLHISEPLTAVDGGRIIVISRRLSHPDGTFAGVVAGSVQLSYFLALFKDAALGPNGSVTLGSKDGILLARWPDSEAMTGRDLRNTELYKRLAQARSGRFETNAIADNVRRLFVYSQIRDLPLVIGVGQSTEGIYAPWRSYAVTVGLVILLLCASSTALAFYLAREMGRRNTAEATLAVLATTDGLTGLSNRRYLNNAIDREWRRAKRDRAPLTLIMCDSDLFKSYNDSFGHQAGDRLLQAIGKAMNQCIKRGTDVAARYGGDEFAILLPSTSAEGGARIAELVRTRVAEICKAEGIAPSHLSVGVASMVPGPGDDQGVLMSAADHALYLAKELGRDRIEVAPTRPQKPTLVATSGLHSAA